MYNWVTLLYSSNYTTLYFNSEKATAPHSSILSVSHSSHLKNKSSVNAYLISFPGGTGGKEPACLCRRLWDVGSIPGWGRPPGEGNVNPLQDSCLGNPMDRGAWMAKSRGLKELDTTEHTHTHTHKHTHTQSCLFSEEFLTVSQLMVHADVQNPTGF